MRNEGFGIAMELKNGGRNQIADVNLRKVTTRSKNATQFVVQIENLVVLLRNEAFGIAIMDCFC